MFTLYIPFYHSYAAYPLYLHIHTHHTYCGHVDCKQVFSMVTFGYFRSFMYVLVIWLCAPPSKDGPRLVVDYRRNSKIKSSFNQTCIKPDFICSRNKIICIIHFMLLQRWACLTFYMNKFFETKKGLCISLSRESLNQPNSWCFASHKLYY